MRLEHCSAADAARAAAALRVIDNAPVSDGWLAQVLADPGHALVVAYDDDQPIGFIYSYELPRFKRDATGALLYEIEVVASHRRQGVGRALVERYLEICRARGIDHVWVVTNASNAAAMRLYDASGASRPNPDDVMWIYDL